MLEIITTKSMASFPARRDQLQVLTTAHNAASDPNTPRVIFNNERNICRSFKINTSKTPINRQLWFLGHTTIIDFAEYKKFHVIMM